MKILLRLSSLKTYIMAFLNCTSDGSEPSHFSRDWAQNFEKGQSSTQAQDQFFEKGLENWDFYVVKNTGLSRLGIEFLLRAWAWTRDQYSRLGIGPGSIF